jgi:hypothetical protein
MLRLLEQPEQPGSGLRAKCAEESVPLMLVVAFVTEHVVFLIRKSLEGVFMLLLLRGAYALIASGIASLLKRGGKQLYIELCVSVCVDVRADVYRDDGGRTII